MDLKNTWIGGLDRDTSKEHNTNATMYDCRNFRVLTDTGLSSSALENIKGNLLSIGVGANLDEHKIIGSCNISDKVILFATTKETPNILVDDYIYELTYDNTTDIPVPTVVLRYVGPLDFSTQYPIYRTVGRVENIYSEKVYWTDSYNVLRYVNILDYDAGTGLYNIPDTSFFELRSNVDMSMPVLAGIGDGGSHTIGVLRYCYQLYNRFGAETIVSELSNLIHVSPSNETASNTQDYEGGDLGEIVSKSYTLRIDNVDSNYDFIKVYRLLYATIDGSPLITLVEDKETSSTVYVTDTGLQNLGTLTEQEFIALSQQDFVCKSITDNRNMLFAANIRESFFDVNYDARALRFMKFSDFSHAYINYPPTALTDYITLHVPNIVTHQAAPQYAETEDKYNVNYFNNLHLTADQPTFDFMYKQNSVALGGTGTNVNYEFRFKQYKIYSHAGTAIYDNLVDYDGATRVINDYTYNNLSYANTASPYLSGLYKFYQRDETYRFGIVFKNKKGLISYVKWIGDIRMPGIMNDTSSAVNPSVGSSQVTAHPVSFFNAGTGDVWANGLYLNMDVNIPQEIADECQEFDIVRVKRERQDRHVVSQGMINYTDIAISGSIWRSTYQGNNALLKTNKDHGRMFLSPEVQYNNNMNISNDDYFMPIAYMTVGGYSQSVPLANSYVQKWREMKSVPPLNDATNAYWRGYAPLEINDSTIVENSQTVSLQNRFTNKTNDGANEIGLGTTAIYFDDGDTINHNILGPAATYDTAYTIWNHKRKLKFASPGDTIGISTQYNGETYISRSRNTYISCGVNKKIDAGAGVYNVDVLGGDTFTCMFDTYAVTQNIPVPAGQQAFNAMIFPVEMSINYPLTSGIIPSRATDYIQAQQFKGIYTTAGGAVYTQEKDMFIYNSAYSKERETEYSIPKPANFLPIDDKPNTVKYSDVKIDGETIDSWCNFKVNNENNSEGRYGEITDIINLNGRLINLQPSGVGVWAVLDRALITDQTGSQLSLGTSGVLSRIDYQSTFQGSKHQSSVLLTADTLYFFDIKNKDWWKLTIGQGQASLTDLKKMSSFLRNNLHPKLYSEDNAINYTSKGFVVGWNKKFNEIYLGIKQKTIHNVLETYENYTIVYNELLGTFTSFYDIPASMFINADNKLLSVPFVFNKALTTVGRNQIYLHDLGVRGEFYGVLYDSKVKFITTLQGKVGVYDNYVYLSETFDANGIMIDDDTFNTIQSSNDYQNSGLIPLVILDADAVGTLRRRMRSWFVYMPRDNSSDAPRMRDAYNMTELVYVNIDDKRFVCHDITTAFKPANN